MPSADQRPIKQKNIHFVPAQVLLKQNYFGELPRPATTSVATSRFSKKGRRRAWQTGVTVMEIPSYSER
jgi:hypothetical protein